MSAILITALVCTVIASFLVKAAYVRGQNSTLTVVLKRLSDLADVPWDGKERRATVEQAP